MAGADSQNDLKTEELTAIIREIRDRARARFPVSSGDSTPFEIPLPDLLPVLHARDAAEAKVASIGTVNPRPGGPLNGLIQSLKKLVGRALDWHVREQVEFNRNTMACIEATLEALNEFNRALTSLSGRLSRQFADLQREIRQTSEPLQQEIGELKDIRAHWVQWRAQWEQKLATNEIQFLRSVADLQGGFQHRATLMESNFRDIVKSQHSDYLAALDRAGADIQKKLWMDMEKIRREYEGMIYSELRTIRQRAAQRVNEQTVPAAATLAPGVPQFDYGRFAEKFRGPEEYVRNGQKFYLPYFAGCKDVLDIGCGRGEFLDLMREADVNARGIDLSDESVNLCLTKGLQAEKADLFTYLKDLPDGALDGIFSAQVVEHLPPERLPEMIRLASAKLRRDGVIVVETPNPECLAIFSTHFFLDPTHTRPIPHPLLAFYMEECGLGRIEVHKLSPAIDSMPALSQLPEEFRNAFFDGLDYGIVGRKLI